jgi:glucosyl-dolichyl phosphate glucuronosyltransferase
MTGGFCMKARIKSVLKNGLGEGIDSMPIFGSARDLTGRRCTGMPPSAVPDQTVCVVIACFDVRRLDLLARAVRSVCEQDYPHELTIVVDYNEDLYWRLFKAIPKDVALIRNTRSRGAAGARNTAALASDCALVAFLDDDAYAHAGWLRSLVHAMDRPGVVGVGGRILPRWHEERPRWFPPEFGWVVGASIAGLGAATFPVRNVWSGSMMVDRAAFQMVNGFREDFGKVGGAARPEDTELCLRISHFYGAAGQWLMVPSAVVEHDVPAHRATLRYVVDRCWLEGNGKVRMRSLSADYRRALVDERFYLSRTIPRGVGAGVIESLRLWSPDGLLRAGTILLGVGAAIFGALAATISGGRIRRRQGESR